MDQLVNFRWSRWGAYALLFLFCSATPVLVQAQVNEEDAREISRRAERDSLRNRRQEERRRALEQEAEKARTDRELRAEVEGDSARETVRDFRVRPGERFDLVFHKGFLFTGSMPDSAPATPLSGTTYMGANFNFVLNRRLALKTGLGVSFFRLVFQQNNEKRFPSIGDTTESEKIRAFYVEVPIGVQITLKRTDKDKLQTYAELGGSIGYNFYSDYKYTRTLPGGFTERTKLVNLANIEKLRYGLYGKLVFKFIAVWGFYRLSDVFTEDGRYDPSVGVVGTGPGSVASATYVDIPRFELGLGIVL